VQSRSSRDADEDDAQNAERSHGAEQSFHASLPSGGVGAEYTTL
jgi:hypothetical protein